MFIKKCSLIFSVIFLVYPSIIFCYIIDPRPYESAAYAWTQTHLESESLKKLRVNQADLQLIANLLYFSYLRSAINLQAHESALNALETVGHGWQNITHTRMNPSRDIPHTINFNVQEKTFTHFMQAQYAHRSIGLSYAYASQAAVNENLLGPTAHTAILALREDARKIVIEAFLDVKKTLGDLYHFASQHLRDLRLEEQEIPSRFDLMESFWQWIPGVAAKSFIEAERIHLQASDDTWHINTTINQVSKHIWEAIETARASYYLAHYRALFQLLQEYDIDSSYTYIMFDEEGILSGNQQEEFLPDLG